MHARSGIQRSHTSSRELGVVYEIISYCGSTVQALPPPYTHARKHEISFPYTPKKAATTWYGSESVWEKKPVSSKFGKMAGLQ